MCIACKLTSEIKYKKNKNIYYLIKIKRKNTQNRLAKQLGATLEAQFMFKTNRKNTKEGK